MPRKMDSRSNILQLCRLCLVKEQVNIDIFNEHGEERQISEKISSCLPVKVSQNDKLPKRICDGCSYKLDMCYEFCNLTVKAEQQLLTWLEDLPTTEKSNDVQNNVAPNNAKPTEAIVKEEQIDPSDVHKEEDDKDYVFAEKVEENNAGPSATVTQEDEPPPKRQRRTAAVKAAIAMDHDSDDDDDSGEPLTKMEDESDDSDGEDNDPSFADIPSTSADDQPGPSGVGKEAADAPFVKIRTRRRRKVREFPPPEFDDCEYPDVEENYQRFACEMCEESIPSSVDFALHSSKHSHDKRFCCHYCNYKTKKASNMKTHMIYHGNDGQLFQCEKCKKLFPECSQAIEHKNFHTGELPYECASCQKHFMFSWLLFTHRRLFHRNEKPSPQSLVCGICNMLFRTESGLRKHVFRKHNNNTTRPLCDVCGKSLANNETLKFHKRTHTGEKPHECGFCGKSFCKKGLLIEHVRIHTGEKPFSCQHCGKSFAQRAPLKIHQRTHTGERPYVCRWCGKGCICKSVLDSHMRTCGGATLINEEVQI